MGRIPRHVRVPPLLAVEESSNNTNFQSQADRRLTPSDRSAEKKNDASGNSKKSSQSAWRSYDSTAERLRKPFSRPS
ncbi:Os08g0176715 [Oryza sativa Japonica Group]|uniref:Os08g0176715 protein n=1 Tax=Oryza sativa subsp. japonica TaxID=39947 RepID=A0A0P0XCE6_ORYSJ|nr:Os08g0176715 [Oryza sativa Japonica Group]